MTLKQGSMGSPRGFFAHITADSAESEGVGIDAKQLFSSANLSSSKSISNLIPTPFESEEVSSVTSEGGVQATNTQNSKNISIIEPAILDELSSQQEHRFFDFWQRRIPSKLHTAFTAGLKRRDLPSEPSNYRQLAGHAFEKEFRDCMDDQIRQHREQFKSWDVVSNKKAIGQQVLGCQWIFKYKTNKHNRLQKCKARIVVCGNQQREHDLPTRATTLAATSLRGCHGSNLGLMITNHD